MDMSSLLGIGAIGGVRAYYMQLDSRISTLLVHIAVR